MNLSEIIDKRILGTITPEESQQLDKWRGENEKNEQIYQRLMDNQFLEREYRRRKSINYKRPLEDMSARIGSKTIPFYRSKTFIRSAAAVVAVVFGLGAGWYALHQSSNMDEELIAKNTEVIETGNIKATLCLANGQTIELGKDSVANIASINKAQGTNLSSSSESSKTRAHENRQNSLIVPRGGEFKVILEDGTEVWLNADSKLIYPEEFSASERRVAVTGEAYFKVAHNAERPFLVETDGQVVKVLGTEFNVHSYSDEPEVITTLVTGKIAMHPEGAENSELLLTPGHQASFCKADHDLTVKSVDTEVVTGWRKGLFVFEDQNLEQIMKALSRWYDFEYRFTSKKVARTEFMGRIPRYSDFCDVAEILEKSGGIKILINGKNVIISDK